jgi:signal transduction histidine kinase
MNAKLLLRVTAPAVLIGLLLLGACLAGAAYIKRLQTNLARILSRNVISLQAAQELEIRVRQLRFHNLLYFVDRDPAALEQIADDHKHFEEALEAARTTAGNDAQRACIDRIAQSYRVYRGEQARLRETMADKKRPLNLKELVRDHPVQLVVTPCQDLLRLNRKSLEEMARDSLQLGQQGYLAMSVLGVVGVVGGAALGYGVARGLSQSIHRLSVRVQDVAQRLDRDVTSVKLVAGGDIQSLDRQLEHVVRRVGEVVERLQEHQRELIRAEQLFAVGQLAASVAHEVRNPLAGIKLLVESALRSRNDKPLTLEDLEVIHREVARLEQTVQGFLEFARLPTPRCSLHDLGDVVHQAIELVGARARQQHVAIDVRGPEGAVPAYVDPSQLKTVLVNLMLNALDAMPGGGRLEVELGPGADGGVRLSVSDTGVGIAPQIAERLFTPFTTTKATGTGLGLSISGRILKEHGGSLSARNRPEGGACFVLTLPPPPGRTRLNSFTAETAESAEERQKEE